MKLLVLTLVVFTCLSPSVKADSSFAIEGVAFEEYDFDGDGAVTSKNHDAYVNKVFFDADKNQDEKLEPLEFYNIKYRESNATEDFIKNQPEGLQKFIRDSISNSASNEFISADLDNNKILDKKEFFGIYESSKAWFVGKDKNEDGKTTLSEIKN